MLLPYALPAAEQATSATDYGNVVAFLSGLTALVSIAITSLRKRKDVSVEEMEKRINDLETSAADREDDLAMAQTAALAASRDVFLLRQVLAQRGIPDPTTTEEVE